MESWHVTTWDWRWPVIYLVDSGNSKQKLALHKALLFLGDLFLVMEDEDTATSLFKVALARFTDMDVHHGRAQGMLRLGNLANRQGHISEAKDFWTAA
jgi:lipoprotein NlpI